MSRINRFERAARNRRRRARAHLERVRAQRSQQPGRAPPRREADFPLRGVVLALSVAAGVLLAGAPWAQRLEAIHVRGAARLSATHVARATGLEPGARLGSVEPRAVARKLREEAWISEARVLRLPHGTLLLDVTERVPAAVVELPEGASAFVDRSGTPFASRDEPAAEGEAPLPRIVPAEPVTPGEASEELARAVRLAERLPTLGVAGPAEVRVAAADDPAGYSLRLPGLAARIVLGRDDLDARLSRLAMLMESGLGALARSSELDLRFAGQAVLRSERRPEGAAQAAAERGDATPSQRGSSG